MFAKDIAKKLIYFILSLSAIIGHHEYFLQCIRTHYY